jgi:hypothetical protein
MDYTLIEEKLFGHSHILLIGLTGKITAVWISRSAGSRFG